jgi:hypothetical protein
LLTLQAAFDGKDRAEILRKIGEDDPTPLRKLNASVPQDLETIIHKAIAVSAAKSQATATQSRIIAVPPRRKRYLSPLTG